MKITITIDFPHGNNLINPDDLAKGFWAQIRRKVREQMYRQRSLCTHPEEADFFRNYDGAVIGSISVER